MIISIIKKKRENVKRIHVIFCKTIEFLSKIVEGSRFFSIKKERHCSAPFGY